MYVFIGIPVGKFNGLDVSIEILINRNAFINRFPSYNGKYPGTGRIEYNWKKDEDEILFNYKYIFLSKIAKKVILWHEYAHHILGDNIIPIYIQPEDRNYDELEYLEYKSETREAMADFYACCKLKLHYKQFLKIFKKIEDFSEDKLNCIINSNVDFEERYENFKKGDFIKMSRWDILYSFYRNPGKLIEIYNIDYEMFSKNPELIERQRNKKLYLSGIISKEEYDKIRNTLYRFNENDNLHKRFDWSKLLIECGWNDKKERSKYFL